MIDSLPCIRIENETAPRTREGARIYMDKSQVILNIFPPTYISICSASALCKEVADEAIVTGP